MIKAYESSSDESESSPLLLGQKRSRQEDESEAARIHSKPRVSAVDKAGWFAVAVWMQWKVIAANKRLIDEWCTRCIESIAAKTSNAPEKLRRSWTYLDSAAITSERSGLHVSLCRSFGVRRHQVAQVLDLIEKACRGTPGAAGAAGRIPVASLDTRPVLLLNDDHSKAFLGLALKGYSTAAVALAQRVSSLCEPFGCPPAYTHHTPHVSFAKTEHPAVLQLASQWKREADLALFRKVEPGSETGAGGGGAAVGGGGVGRSPGTDPGETVFVSPDGGPRASTGKTRDGGVGNSGAVEAMGSGAELRAGSSRPLPESRAALVPFPLTFVQKFGLWAPERLSSPVTGVSAEAGNIRRVIEWSGK